MTIQAAGLRCCWPCDESAGNVAWNAVSGAAAIDLRGGRWTQGRFGAALALTEPGHRATTRWDRELPQFTLAFQVYLDRPTQPGVLMTWMEQLRLTLTADAEPRWQCVFHGQSGPSVAAALERWTAVALSLGGGELRMALDGRVVAAMPWTGVGLTAPTSDAVASLAFCGLPSSWTPCRLDDISVWDRPLGDDELRALASGPAPVAAPVAPARGGDVDVTAWLRDDDSARGLQAAIDACGPEGGRVLLPPGRWLLRRGLRLTSRVEFAGSGPATVLTRPPQRAMPLACDALAGDRAVTLRAGEAAVDLRVGDAVLVQSTMSMGYHATHALVTAVEGARVSLSQAIVKDCLSADGAVLVNAFSMLAMPTVNDAVVRDLTIAGGDATIDRTAVNFTAAAITCERSLAIRVQGCRIQHWPHDGICFGKGSWHQVHHNLVEACGGHGLHPGNRMRSCEWTHNVSRRNHGDGFFFCCNVEENLVAMNLLEENRGHGIGDLGGCNDLRNLATANRCLNNGMAGVHLNGGADNVATGNLCVGNSRSKPGAWGGIHIMAPTQRPVVAQNIGPRSGTADTQRDLVVDETIASPKT